MTRNKWIRIAAVSGMAGGVAWLGKLAVLMGAGREGGADVPLFAVGLALLLVGSTGVGAAVSRRWPTAAGVAAIVLSPALALAAFVGAQIATEPLTGVGPAALAGEYGIVILATLGLLLGSHGLLRSAHRTRELAR